MIQAIELCPRLKNYTQCQLMPSKRTLDFELLFDEITAH